MKIHQLRKKNFICTINPALIEESQLKKFISQGLIPEDVTTDSNPVIAIVEVSYKADKK